MGWARPGVGFRTTKDATRSHPRDRWFLNALLDEPLGPLLEVWKGEEAFLLAYVVDPARTPLRSWGETASWVTIVAYTECILSEAKAQETPVHASGLCDVCAQRGPGGRPPGCGAIPVDVL